MNQKNEYTETSKGLAEFIRKSPTAFHAVDSIRHMLEENGFVRLCEEDRWNIAPGGKYYCIRNYSSIVAADLGNCEEGCSFQITASHSDSPSFKVKEHALLEVRGKYTQVNTEGYGGMLCAPWFDRPLSFAGKVIANIDGTFETRLFTIDRDLVMIPNVAIHMNRSVNDGMSYNKQIDMLPLLSSGSFSEAEFTELIASAAGVRADQICGSEIFLYNRMAASVWGSHEEFLSAPRLDDLQCAYTALMGFLQGGHEQNINVYACLDNEEVGSGTKQGAASTFLADVLQRLYASLGKSKEDYHRAVASGFMLSCDNAHAMHPNHPGKTDDKNCVFLNEGVVIKSHAGQKYTSDAVSIALFKEICRRSGVPVQYFANRSDAAGGSTLGNIAMTQVSMNCIDIGLPQLAMHSPYETAGIKDTKYMIDAIAQFYQTHFQMSKDCFRLS